VPVAMAVLKAGQKGGRAAPARKAAPPPMPALKDVPPAMLQDYLRKLFAISDVNGDGVLQPQEFADLLSRSGFNLPPQVILKLVRDADVRHDGVIAYDEYIPAMARLVNAPPE